MARKSYEERLQGSKNPLLKKLFKIIIEKQSNLCVAVDFSTLEETIDFIDRCGKHICIVKTHPQKYKDAGTEESLAKLFAKKKEHNFLLFSDEKYYDSPDVVREMYEYTCMKYADLVTMVPVSGDDSFKAFRLALNNSQLPDDEPRGCLAVCEVSFGSFDAASPKDPQGCLEVAARNSDFCLGIVAQNLRIPDGCDMIKATPGVHLCRTDGGLSQKWKPPSDAIGRGADIVIVGRGIIASPKDEQEMVCCQYKEASYKAYLADLNRGN